MQLEEHLGWCTRQSLNFAALEFVSQCHNKYWMMFVCKAFFADVVAALQSLEEFEAFRSSLNNSVKIETTYWVCDSWQTFCGFCEFGHSCAACVSLCVFCFPFSNMRSSLWISMPASAVALAHVHLTRWRSVNGMPSAGIPWPRPLGRSLAAWSVNPLGFSAFALKEIFPVCQCRRKKVFNNEAALTELNKFDDLMRPCCIASQKEHNVARTMQPSKAK